MKKSEEKEYQKWKKESLDEEYEKAKETEWVTVPYSLAGMGQYSETMEKSEVKSFEAWIKDNGSAVMGEPEKATEEEIKTVLAKRAH